ncbi:MAG: type IV toxin-antitoxin system AbiEi family antitoxin domain-containing protein [Coriobacteriales bacterium]|jgi:predicted transcriptional regulator of viral defense system
MKFTEYINGHHVFTTASLLAASDSPAAAEEQLRLAVRSGAVEHVRRGLLVSNHGRFEDSPVEQAEIVAALDANAVISYHSALEAHGVAHNEGFVCHFRSNVVRTGFEFRGVTYHPCGPVGDAKAKAMRSAGGVFLATTREQTVIDCLGKPALAGGVEEAVRSLTAFVYLDVEGLVDLAVDAGPSAAARVGWLLSEKRDEWHVVDDLLAQLENRLGPGPYRLGHASAESTSWVARWKLILPDETEEVASWITHS